MIMQGFKLRNFATLVLMVATCFCFKANSAQCVTPRGGYYHNTFQAELVYYTLDAGSVENCSETVILSGLEYARLKTLEEQYGETFLITPEDIAISFTWGFGTYLTFWWIGFKVRTSRKLIKSL